MAGFMPVPQKSETPSQQLKVARALRKGQWMLSSGYAALYGAFITVGHWFFHKHVDWTDYVTVGVLIPIGIILRSSGARISREALETLSRERDSQAIGHVINTLLGANMSDWASVTLAQNALPHLLPRLTKEEASRLGIWQRRFLYNRVKFGNPDKEGDLLIALLDAFERLKDTRALPAVRRLLRREVKTHKGRRVQEKVQQCLTVLIEQSAQTKADTTLLRAADTTEELLHPVTSTQEDAPQQFLRPPEEGNE